MCGVARLRCRVQWVNQSYEQVNSAPGESMNQSKASTKHQIAFWFYFLGSLLMACFSWLGFFGWSSDPSNQKWWALGCAVFFSVGSVLAWTSKHEITAPSDATVWDADQAIAKETVQAQRRYWKQEISNSLVGIAVVFAICLLLLSVWVALRDYFWLVVYLLISCLWSGCRRILEATRQLAQLNR